MEARPHSTSMSPQQRQLISKKAAGLLTVSSRNRHCWRHNENTLYPGKLYRTGLRKEARSRECHTYLREWPRQRREAQLEDFLSTAKGESWENGGVGCGGALQREEGWEGRSVGGRMLVLLNQMQI